MTTQDRASLLQKGARSRSTMSRRYHLVAMIPDPGELEVWDVIDSFEKPVEAIRASSHCHAMIRNLLQGRRDPAGEADRRIRIHDAVMDRWVLRADEETGVLWFDPNLFDGPVPLDSLPD